MDTNTDNYLKYDKTTIKVESLTMVNKGNNKKQSPSKSIQPDGITKDSDSVDNTKKVHYSPALMQTLADASFEAIFLSEKGKCIAQNLTAEKMFGYSSEDAVGRMGTDWIAPQDRKLVMKNMLSGFEGPYKVTAIRKDGTTFPCEIQGRMIEYGGKQIRVTALRNIRSIVNTEKSLKESERKNNALLNAIPDIMFIISKDGAYLDYRCQDHTKLAVPPYKFMGRKIKDILPSDIANQALITIKKAIETREVAIIEYSLNINNNRMHFEGRAVAIDDYKVLFIVRDITETKRLQELESRALRLETAGRIAGQVAHDFNNLLGPLVAYPELIRYDLPPNHKVIPYLENMEKSARQMADINQQLLTLGRRGHYNLLPMNINDVIDHVINDLSPFPDHIQFKLNLCDGIMKINGGEAQIYRIIANLINNGCDAIIDNGVLSIKTENYYVDELAIVYGRVPKGEYVKVTITDTGTGIPNECLQKIFDPFFTTKSTDKVRGSGLGLSVVDSVVRDHNGYIDLKTKMGEGTSFYLYFPITRDSIKANQPLEIIGGKEKILVIDDDPVQRDVSEKILGRLGYKICTAESGEEAVEVLKKDNFDLILLDMVMPPGMDGTETYRQISEFKPDLKAIIVSGFSETSRVLEAQKLGACSFIKKPFTFQAIACAVRKELDRSANIPI